MPILRQQNPNIQFQERNNLDFPLHLHNVLEVALIREGSATAICGSTRYALKPGDVFISFPNQPHGYEDSVSILSDVLIVPLHPFLSPWRSILTQKLPIFPVLSRTQWENTSIPALLALLRRSCRTLSQPVLQGYAMVLAGTLLPLLPLTEQPAEGRDMLRTLLLYISEHYREPITRKDIAEGVGYNESYISHTFSENFSTTLMDYVNSLRLNDAKSLLKDTDLPVSSICMQLGFGSLRSFNRLFVQQEGCSPTAYRRRK